ncbi:unnamed protein product [Jaminaea pallidilutea]
MVKLTGVLPAVPTPFTAQGDQVDRVAIKALVERLVEAGVHGLVTTGTTGEFTALTDEEYKLVIKTYVEAAAGRIPVVAGFGCLTTKGSVELAQWCESAGVAACMVVPPFYDPLSFEALKGFLKAVCGAIKIPIMYYNLPGATGIQLTAAQIRDLGQIKGLDYLKDTSGNAKEQVDMLTQPTRPEGISLFNGWDTLTFSAMALGATASVWGLHQLYRKKQSSSTRRWWSKEISKPHSSSGSFCGRSAIS